MSLLYPQVFILFLALFWIVGKKFSLLALSIALAIVALSRPVLTQVHQSEKLQGKEFIIALDVSYSMRAEDIKPNRLTKAKEIIHRILEENPQDRFSLFAFTTNPLILCPSSSDHQLLLLALDSLKVDNILTHGTSLQKLFKRIHKLNMPEKNLILLSDGGDESTVDSFDINVFSIMIASKQGSTLKDKYGKTMKDDKGHIIISRQNPLLKEISTKIFTHDEMDYSLDFVTQKEMSQKEKKGFYELFWIPLLASLGLFFLYYVKIPKKILALIPFLTLNSDAGLLDWYYIQEADKNYHDKSYKEAAKGYQQLTHKTMQSQMNLANTYYQAGAYTKAKSIYNQLKSSNPKLKKKLLFKLGNCATKLEDYESAKGYYHDALVFGKDEDILFNLKQIANKKRNSHAPKKAGKDKDKVKSSQTAGKAKESKTGENTSAPSKLSRPLGFKAYELINKGYIDEKTPW